MNQTPSLWYRCAVAAVFLATHGYISGRPATAAESSNEPCRPADPTVSVLVGEKASAAERLFQAELIEMLGALYPHENLVAATGSLSPKGRAILLGTPQSFPLVTRFVDPAELERPESFAVTNATQAGCQLGIIAGADARGVGYGVYGLLERLGWGWYLSYDARPAARKLPLSFDDWQMANAPGFTHRVVFNWHNFLSGCSTWNLEDWKQWIARSQRMGYNAVMVHAYGNNPMVEFGFNGQTKPVGYLSSTQSGRDWATMHVNDVRRLWGGQVFDAPVFGSQAALVPDERRAQAVERMMADAFQSARDRAMDVWFAFDIETPQANPQNVILTLPEDARFLVPSHSGPEDLWLANPDTPQGYAYYKAQVQSILEAYPQITTLVCWFRWGANTPWMKMSLEHMPAAWQAEYRAELAKTPEAAGLELAEGCFALSKAVRAYGRALRELGRGDVSLATGTWRFAFYPPCHRFMPREVAFVGLDYEVLGGHSCFDEAQQRAQQAAIGSQRTIVPIAWAHHDDGAYLGRPYTPFGNFSDKLDAMHAAGYGIIHWTTRPLDVYFKSLVRQVWRSSKNEPLAETCADMAAKTFGAAARQPGGAYLEQWVTKAPQFSRETSERFVDRPLADPIAVAAESAARLKMLDGIDRRDISPSGAEWIQYYRGLERYIADVHRNEARYRETLELLNKGDRPNARHTLEACDPEQTIARYASFSGLQGISRGEQGTIVSMNTRWLPHYARLRQSLGLEAIRYKFGPTQHDPLAQSAGYFSFFFDGNHRLWQTLGTEETRAKTFVLRQEITLPPDRPDLAEIGQCGVVVEKPLTLAVRPILARAGGRESAALALPAGQYRLTLLTVSPPESRERRVFDATLTRLETAAETGYRWYTFAPVKARYIRLACHGSNENGWDSIAEVELDALDRGRGSVQASGAVRGYPAAYAADGNTATRWAVEGRDHWIQFRLDGRRATSRIGVAWFGGAARQPVFDLLVSSDGQQWMQAQQQPVAPPAAGPTADEPTVRFTVDGAGDGRLLTHDVVASLDRPGALELTVTPVVGPILLGGFVLEPLDTTSPRQH